MPKYYDFRTEVLVFKEKTSKTAERFSNITKGGTLDQIRTDTIQGLSLSPLPLGYESILVGDEGIAPTRSRRSGIYSPADLL